MTEELQEQQVVEENVSTPDTAGEEQVTQEPVKENEVTYTKEQVTNIMKRRVERSHNAFFKRYNVKDLDELDGVFNSIGDLKNQIGELTTSNGELTKKIALLENDIDPAKYDEIDRYFGDNFNADELVKHPEWRKARINVMGNEKPDKKDETNQELAERIFGMKF